MRNKSASVLEFMQIPLHEPIDDVSYSAATAIFFALVDFLGAVGGDSGFVNINATLHTSSGIVGQIPCYGE